MDFLCEGEGKLFLMYYNFIISSFFFSKFCGPRNFVPGVTAPVALPTLRLWFEEIRKMNATLQVVAVDVVTIKDTTKELKVENIQIRLAVAEQQISDIEDVHAQMEKNMKCDKKLETLWTRVEDLENRSQRNNVRLVGLKEGKEDTGDSVCWEDNFTGT